MFIHGHGGLKRNLVLLINFTVAGEPVSEQLAALCILVAQLAVSWSS